MAITKGKKKPRVKPIDPTQTRLELEPHQIIIKPLVTEKGMHRSTRYNAYAFEELIAEFASAMMCGALGVTDTPRPDHAAYIASWLTVLKSDKRAIFSEIIRVLVSGGIFRQAIGWLVKTPTTIRPFEDTWKMGN